jgi:serine/threonine protein kinase
MDRARGRAPKNWYHQLVSLVGSGKSLAGYRLIELAGEGGMGRVYRAVQPGTERVVALKVIRPELASDEDFRRRFEVESRLAASIDHPGVVPVYGAGEADDVLYVAMRWVEGRDLRRLLADEGPLEPERAVDLLARLADGLDAAHAGGLIHRDIKPANVLLEGEEAFLSDFGLARTTSGGDETQVGGVVGTVDYLAPELADGGTATPASDIYALGCVFFQTLTGSVPFPVDGLIAKLNAHTKAEPPAPSALRPELPRGFDAVLERALAKDPARRPRTATELAEAARKALRTAPPGERRSGRKRPAMLAAAGVAVAAIAVAAVLALSGGSKHGSGATPKVVPFPTAASLSPCANLLTAPSGDCRDSAGGVVAFAAEGKPARLRTLDFEVGKVFQTRAIVEPSSRDTVTAPPGQRFVVVESMVTNRLPRAQVFEPDQFAGRQTALFLYGAGGERLASKGPHFADYSEQNLPATGLVPLALIGTRLPPPRPTAVPFDGALVFSYPTAELRKARTMLLFVNEFGGAAEGAKGSVGVLRIAVGKTQMRKAYEGLGI